MESMKGRRSFLKALFAAPVMVAAAPAIAAKVPASKAKTQAEEVIKAFNFSPDTLTMNGISYPIVAGSKLNFTITAEKFQSGMYARFASGVIRGPGPDGKVMNFFPAFSPPVAIKEFPW